MKSLFTVVLCVLSFGLHAYEVSLDAFVANPGQRVSVPVRFDTVKGASRVGVRVTYDPQVLVFVKASEGSLTKMLSDDYVVVGDEKNGSVSVSAFGEGNVAEDIGGTLAQLVFVVRDGTQGLYSDVSVADVSVGEKTGVRDLTVDNPIRTRGGMVRVVSRTSAVDRLEGSQIVCAEAVMGSLALKAGDGIQASDDQSAVVVTGTVTAETWVRVMPPSEGWASGRYELLKTPTTGLEFFLEGAPLAWRVESTESNGVTTYWVDGVIESEIAVVSESEDLSAGARNVIRKALDAAGKLTKDVKRISVNGPKGRISLIADLGIAPAISGTVDATGTLNVTYSLPTMTITAFDPKTGIVKIRVVPGEGNTIVSEMATGYVHVYGTSGLGEKMKYISKVAFDLTPYLKSESKGEAALAIELGAYSFLKVKIEDVAKSDGDSE